MLQCKWSTNAYVIHLVTQVKIYIFQLNAYVSISVYMYVFRYKNGEIFHIQSLFSESITLIDVTQTDTAYYHCQASNEFSTVTSRSVSISVQGYKNVQICLSIFIKLFKTNSILQNITCYLMV